MKTYETLTIMISNYVAIVQLNRPDKANAINAQMVVDLQEAFTEMGQDSAVRVISIKGSATSFCSGLDLNYFKELLQAQQRGCEGRKRENLRQLILQIQQAVSTIENCHKPVIAAIHGACLGGGLDIIAACDMRYCSSDAFFSIKEIDLGFAADLGSLQRLPAIIGRGMLCELAYTGRRVSGEEAKKINLVNDCFPSDETLQQAVVKIAELIAAKSPLAVRSIKEMLLYARDHNVTDSLNYAATWNAGMMLSDDMNEAFEALVEKRQAIFD